MFINVRIIINMICLAHTSNYMSLILCINSIIILFILWQKTSVWSYKSLVNDCIIFKSTVRNSFPLKQMLTCMIKYVIRSDIWIFNITSVIYKLNFFILSVLITSNNRSISLGNHTNTRTSLVLLDLECIVSYIIWQVFTPFTTLDPVRFFAV